MKYFSLQHSNLSAALCLFGEKSITLEFLLKSFRECITAEDREVLSMCLRDNFDSQDHDGKPDKDNIRSIISELAHQEFIQKPRYVLHCWAPILDVQRCEHSF